MAHGCPHLDAPVSRRERHHVERRWLRCFVEGWWCDECDDVVVRLYWPPPRHDRRAFGWTSSKARACGDRMRLVEALARERRRRSELQRASARRASSLRPARRRARGG